MISFETQCAIRIKVIFLRLLSSGVVTGVKGAECPLPRQRKNAKNRGKEGGEIEKKREIGKKRQGFFHFAPPTDKASYATDFIFPCK